MRTFIRLSAPSSCDKHSPRTFCRLICLLNSLCLVSYSHCWGFTAVLTLLWCYCCYNHSVTIKITKDLVSPVLCSEHYLLPILLWKKVLPFSALGSSPNSAHDSQWVKTLLRSTTHTWADPGVHVSVHYTTEELPHLHYSAAPLECSEHIQVSGLTTDLLVDHSSGHSQILTKCVQVNF